MKLSLKVFKKFFQNKPVIFLLAILYLSPFSVTAQSNREADDNEPVVETSVNSGPWGNSAGSTIGSSGNALSEGTAKPADPNLNSANAARPAAGPTPDATGGPGGNPDVPFDSNMNLVFLVAGIIFAFVVYKRRFKLKTVPAKNI